MVDIILGTISIVGGIAYYYFGLGIFEEDNESRSMADVRGDGRVRRRLRRVMVWVAPAPFALALIAAGLILILR